MVHINQSYDFQGGRPRSFQTTWYEQFPWLEYSPKLDAAFCFCCRLYAAKMPGCAEPAFVFSGMKNWRKALGKDGKLTCHAQSNIHKNTWTMWMEAKSQPCSVAAQLDSAYRQQVKKNREYLKCIIETLVFLAKHNIAIRGHDESLQSVNRGNFLDLLDLRSKDNPLLQEYLKKNYPYSSPSFQNELIDIIGNQIRSKIIERCHSSKFFSIIVDETTDISHVEQVSVVIRFIAVEYGKCIVEEHFVGFWATHTTTGQALLTLLQQILSTIGLCFSNLRAQCYDGASNMRGRYSGLSARVKEIEPRAIYTHCYAHILNLVLSHACQSIQDVRNAFGILASIYNFIEGSAKRHHVFQTIMKESGDKVVTLKRLCETRWHCRYESVRAIKLTFKSLCCALNEINEQESNQTGAEAMILLKSVTTFEFIFSITILESVFSLTNMLSKQLQERGADISNLQLKVNAVIDTLKLRRSEQHFKSLWDEVTAISQELDLEPPSLPRHRKVPRRIDDASEGVSFSSCEDKLRITLYYALLDCIIEEISDRFKENDIHWLKLLHECLLDWTNTNPEHISELEIFYKIQGLKAEFQVFHAYAKKNLNQMQTFLELANAMIEKDISAMFSGVWDLVKIALCIPVSSASSERSFSALRRLKTYLRSTMGQQRLSNLAIVHVEQEVASKLDYSDIVDIFASKQRRMDL